MNSSEPFMASYNGSDLLRSVDPSKHHDRWINIQRMIKAANFLLQAMRINRDPPSAIGRSPSLATIQSNDASSESLIAIRRVIQRLRLFLVLLNVVLRDEERARDYSSNSHCLVNHFA